MSKKNKRKKQFLHEQKQHVSNVIPLHDDQRNDAIENTAEEVIVLETKKEQNKLTSYLKFIMRFVLTAILITVAMVAVFYLIIGLIINITQTILQSQSWFSTDALLIIVSGVVSSLFTGVLLKVNPYVRFYKLLKKTDTLEERVIKK